MQLLEEYKDIFAASVKECQCTGLVQHGMEMGNTQPIHLQPHWLALAKQQAAEDMVCEMLDAGVIEPSNNPWAAPVVLMRKKGGGWRFCVDYRRLNAITKKNSYPLPCIDSALDHIAGSSWFSLSTVSRVSRDTGRLSWQPKHNRRPFSPSAQRLWQF